MIILCSYTTFCFCTFHFILTIRKEGCYIHEITEQQMHTLPNNSSGFFCVLNSPKRGPVRGAVRTCADSVQGQLI